MNQRLWGYNHLSGFIILYLKIIWLENYSPRLIGYDTATNSPRAFTQVTNLTSFLALHVHTLFSNNTIRDGSRNRKRWIRSGRLVMRACELPASAHQSAVQNAAVVEVHNGAHIWDRSLFADQCAKKRDWIRGSGNVRKNVVATDTGKDGRN